jgi:preprotein translocase subunit SecE
VKGLTKKELTKKEVTDQENQGNLPQLTKFAEETKEELAKVVWPSRQQLISESAAVMLMVILVATIISLVDKFFSWGAGKVFGG